MHAELFRLADAAWDPPATVLVRHGARRSSLVADFKSGEGKVFRLTTRIDRVSRELVSEEMAVRFILRGAKS